MSLNHFTSQSTPGGIFNPRFSSLVVDNTITAGELDVKSLVIDGDITVTGDATVDGKVTCGSLVTPSIQADTAGTGLVTITSSAGSTTTGFSMLQVNSGASPVAGNLYGLCAFKQGTGCTMIGVNKNTTTGQLPASCGYLSTFSQAQTLSIGRGSNAGNLPGFSDIYIDANGNVSCTNGLLSASSLSLSTQSSIIAKSTTAQSVTTGVGTNAIYTNVNTVGSNISYNTTSGVFTVLAAGTYSVSCSCNYTSNATGAVALYIEAVSSGPSNGQNGYVQQENQAAINIYLSTSSNLRLAANDTFTINIFQGSGGNLNCNSNGSANVCQLY